MNVLVSHGSALQLSASGLPGTLEPEVGHHRGDKALIGQSTTVLQNGSPEIQHMVAVNNAATTVHSEHAIGITVKSEAHRRSTFNHRLAQRSEMGGTTAHVDSLTVSDSVQHREIGPE